MSIKHIVFSLFAVTAFSSFAMAQGGGRQPNQPNQPNQPRRDGDFRRGGGDKRELRRSFVHRGPGMMGPGRIDFNRLNLTDAQKQRIQTLLENNRKTHEANQAQREEMGRLMQFKRQGLLTTEQGTRLTALEAQMKTNADKMQSDLMAVFTPEQKTLVEQMRSQWGGGEGRGGRMRLRMQGPRGPGAGGGGMNRPGGPIGGGNQPPPPPMDN